ncbi:MAG: hypothetical protein MPN21_24110 [Thermoanaerobaculia bacterium]|nr:hypothetical protein [Thermoanaerobaculia bacterium]
MIGPLRKRIAELLDRALEAGLQVPQDTGMLSIDPSALESVVVLVDETIDALADVATACEEELETGEVEASLPPAQLGDLAFVARSELAEIRDNFRSAIDQDSMWQIAAHADRAVGRSVRALMPVESALREYEGLEPQPRVWFDLDDTLEIRRRFVRFWLEVHRVDSPGGDELVTALERVASMIEELREDSIYPYLRLDDRLDLRALQKRILAWLERQQKDSDEIESGRRLWQDASGFFNLLMQIQRREELRENDLIQLGRALRRLQDEEGDRLLKPKTQAELSEMLLEMAGRESSLDKILVSDDPVSANTMETAARKLHAKLLRR